MSSTYVDVTEKNGSMFVVGYGMKFPREDRERFPLYPSRIFQPASGLCSTVGDLIKFYKAHLYGNEILLPDSLKREMQRIQVKMKNSIRGIGFGLSNKPEGKIAGHIGGGLGYRSMSGLIQEGKIVVVVFVNAVNVGIDGFFYGLCDLILTLDSRKHDFLDQSETSLNFLDVVGFYDSLKGWGPELFCQINSKLVLLNPESKYPGSSMQILRHKADKVFTPSRETPTAKPGEDIKFVDGSDGDKIYIDSKKVEHKRFTYTY